MRATWDDPSDISRWAYYILAGLLPVETRCVQALSSLESPVRLPSPKRFVDEGQE